MKTTKHSLLMSAVALLLCCSMLIGTTFAWFTDSVTSSGNKIQSGTLKVDLELFDKTTGEWNSLKTSKAPIFNCDKWEPGYTDVKILKVENEGTLALKWVAQFVANDDLSILANVIDVYVLPSKTALTMPADRSLDGYTKVGTVREFVNTIEQTTYGTLLANDNAVGGEDEAYLGIALKMQEDVGNEYQNLDLGGTFDIRIYASQLTFESDSVDNQYDKDAKDSTYLNTATSVYDSTLQSGIFKLDADISTADSAKHYNGNREYAIQGGRDYTLDLNGHTINHNGVYQDGKNTGYTYLYTVTSNSKLTIDGQGTINSENSEGNVSIVYAQGTGEMVINGGNFNAKRGIAVWAGGTSQVTINGGSFISNGSNNEELIYSSGGVININGGFFHNTGWPERPVNVANSNRSTGRINIYGGTFVGFDPSKGGDDPEQIKVADGYAVVSAVQDNGDVWYTVVPDALSEYKPAFDKTDIQNLVATGEKVVIATDISATPNTETFFEGVADKEFVVDGAGSVITTSGTGTASGNYGYVAFVPANGKNATVNNVTVEGQGFVEVGDYDLSRGGDYVINNMVIKNFASTYAVKNGSDTVSAAFGHYGNAVMNNCVMTGTTSVKDGYDAYDVGLPNKSNTTINGGEYGKIYVWSQAHVTINNAEVSYITSSAITTNNLGMLTIGAGTNVGTIELTCADKYTPALTIENGATVDAVIYKGVSYTQAEWLER